MTVTAKPLVASKFAEDSTTTQYTVGAGVRTYIDKFTATNSGASSATLSVYLVPSGGSAGASNQVIVTKALAVGETYTFPEIVGQILSAGEFVATNASAASTLMIRISGREMT